MNLNEKTTISISLVIALIGGISWLTWIAFETRANSASVIEIRKYQDTRMDFEREILQRLSRIEEKISK